MHGCVCPMATVRRTQRGARGGQVPVSRPALERRRAARPLALAAAELPEPSPRARVLTQSSGFAVFTFSFLVCGKTVNIGKVELCFLVGPLSIRPERAGRPAEVRRAQWRCTLWKCGCVVCRVSVAQICSETDLSVVFNVPRLCCAHGRVWPRRPCCAFRIEETGARPQRAKSWVPQPPIGVEDALAGPQARDPPAGGTVTALSPAPAPGTAPSPQAGLVTARFPRRRPCPTVSFPSVSLTLEPNSKKTQVQHSER